MLSRTIESLFATLAMAIIVLAQDGDVRSLVPPPAAIDRAHRAMGFHRASGLRKSEPRKLLRSARALKLRAGDEKLDPATRHACLEQALLLALQVGDLRLADDVESDHLGIFDVSERELAALTLSKMRGSTGGRRWAKALVNGYLHMAHRAVLEEDYLRAQEMVEHAASCAKGRYDKARCEAEGEILDRCLDHLPDRSEGSIAVMDLLLGCYLCLLRGDWIRGAPILERAAEPPLPQLTREEQRMPVRELFDQTEQGISAYRLGRSWFEASRRCRFTEAGLSTRTRTVLRRRMQDRAAVWLERSLPFLTDKEHDESRRRALQHLKSLPDVITRLEMRASISWARVRGLEDLAEKIRKDPALWHLVEAREAWAACQDDFDFKTYNELRWAWSRLDTEEGRYQCEIIFANAVMQPYTLDCLGARTQRTEQAIATLKQSAEEFPCMKHMMAACYAKIGDIQAQRTPPRRREAASWYRRVIAMGGEVSAYVDLARKRLDDLHER